MPRLAIPVLLAFATLAPGARAEGSLDDVVKGMLGEPSIQVAIKVTPRQRAKSDARIIGSVFRTGLEMARSAAKDGSANFKWEYMNTSRLTPTDLTEVQRRRARQIAIQTRVLDALLTSDLALALDLKPTQIARLTAISSDRNRANAKLMSTKRFQSFSQKYAAMAKAAEGEESSLSEMSDEAFAKVIKMTDQMSLDIAELAVEMNERQAPANALGNKRALRVLTASQRAQLRRLKGPKFAG